MSKFAVVCRECGSEDVRVQYQEIKNGMIRGRGYCRTCGASDNLSQNLSPGEYHMPFGQHKGRTLQEIKNEDRRYLDWLLTADVSEGIKAKVRETLGLTAPKL